VIHLSADCLFCKIVRGEIPAAKVFENDQVLAFKDINPQAPVHLLVIPKKHVASFHQVPAVDAALMGQLTSAIQQVAAEAGIAETGYRVLTNNGPDAGQVVFHLHFHVLGGKPLGHLA
jgi:histidine triad (HIT) family protein